LFKIATIKHFLLNLICGIAYSYFYKNTGIDFFKLLRFSVTDIIDIFLVAYSCIMVTTLVRGTVAINIFMVLSLFGILEVDRSLDMKMISRYLGGFMQVGLKSLSVKQNVLENVRGWCNW